MMMRRSMFAAVAGLALTAAATTAQANDCNAKVLTGLWSGGADLVFPSEACSLHIDKSDGKISDGHCWPLGSIYPVDATGSLSIDKKCRVAASIKIDAGRLGKFSFKLNGKIEFRQRGTFKYKYIRLKSDKNSLSLSQVYIEK
jgi:hypothetical protein